MPSASRQWPISSALNNLRDRLYGGPIPSPGKSLMLWQSISDLHSSSLHCRIYLSDIVVITMHMVSSRNQVCPDYWKVPMSTAKLRRVLRICIRCRLLPIEQGCHLHLPRHSLVCRMYHTGAVCDERHMLLECPALADLRQELPPLCRRVLMRIDQTSALTFYCFPSALLTAWKGVDELQVSLFLIGGCISTHCNTSLPSTGIKIVC